jgi:hypothetical protein
MISCNLKTDANDLNERGFPKHSCRRCSKSWHQCGSPSEWKGDPVYCKGTPAWWEVGCWFNILLEVFGINAKRFSWLKHKLGFVPKCDCHEREEKLNTLGQRLARNYEWAQNIAIEWTCYLIRGHKYQCSLDGCKCRYCGKLHAKQP